MSGRLLSAALRDKAIEVRHNINCATTVKEDQTLRDAADLLHVLAKIVEGRSLIEAFGAPGDWGYETKIGQGVAAMLDNIQAAPKPGGAA